MAERLIIDNFAGIKHAEIDLKPINIFIGEHATGKSVAAKLVYLFRGIFENGFEAILKNQNKSYGIPEIQSRFTKFFPLKFTEGDNYSITFQADDKLTFRFRTSKTGRSFSIPNDFIDVWSQFQGAVNKIEQKSDARKGNLDITGIQQYFEKDRLITEFISNHNQFNHFSFQDYIASSRTIFPQIGKAIFTLMRENIGIDPSLVEFGAKYESLLKSFKSPDEEEVQYIDLAIQDEIMELMKGTLIDINSEDAIRHFDGRTVDLLFTSSGQQNLLLMLAPLVMIEAFTRFESNHGVYLEEPEIHIFPTTQNKVVRLLSKLFNKTEKRAHFVITTHSPYILTSFNNLMKAGHLAKHESTDEEALKKIVPKELWLDPDNVAAYIFENGTCRSIIDSETGMIGASEIDTASESIAQQFDELLDLEYGH